MLNKLCVTHCDLCGYELNAQDKGNLDYVYLVLCKFCFAAMAGCYETRHKSRIFIDELKKFCPQTASEVLLESVTTRLAYETGGM